MVTNTTFSSYVLIVETDVIGFDCQCQSAPLDFQGKEYSTCRRNTAKLAAYSCRLNRTNHPRLLMRTYLCCRVRVRSAARARRTHQHFLPAAAMVSVEAKKTWHSIRFTVGGRRQETVTSNAVPPKPHHHNKAFLSHANASKLI